MKLFTASALLVLFVFLGLGTIVARKIKEASDYTVAGRKAGVSSRRCCYGGSYWRGYGGNRSDGLRIWPFSMVVHSGGGIGCLILGWGFASPLRSSGVVTIPEFLKRHYGRSVSMLSMVASSVGTYISVVAQFLSGVALLRTVFSFPSFVASIGVACLILSSVFRRSEKLQRYRESKWRCSSLF